MKLHPTPIAAGVALFLLGYNLNAQAQQAQGDMQQVTVTGIRASLQQSLNQKRNAGSVVEVVTAEDVGKMPDKNVADAIQRIPGVNISSSAGGEGGFDENDRVSIRGTNPSLTQTLVNGHSVGTGDWFILNQVGNVGRSVSYALLPSELVGRVTVNKSATADLVEGGAAGAVNVETRKPLDAVFKTPFSLEATLQAVYSDLPKKTDPQLSVLGNWRNDEKTLGVLVQLFSQTRKLRRDGQEFLGYSTIAADNALAVAHPELSGVAYPVQIGSALFTQERKREGGAFEFQIKPSSDVTLGLNGFYSKLSAKNYNSNFMANPDSLISHEIEPTSYTVRNGTLVAAAFPVTAAVPPSLGSGVVDAIYRPGSQSQTSYLNLDGKWRVTSSLTFVGQAGTTRGIGETAKEVAYEGLINNAGLTYSMNGSDTAAPVTFPGANTANFAGTLSNGGWGSKIKSTDSEDYGSVDGELALDGGLFSSLKFGLRFANHERDIDMSSSVAKVDPVTSSPAWGGSLYPSNFGSKFGSPLSNVWLLNTSDIESWWDQNFMFDPVRSPNYAYMFNVKENTSAGYVMTNLTGDKWSGNVGVRVVKTKQKTTTYELGGTDLVGSDSGDYDIVVKERSYTDVLPSANVKFDVTKDVVVRAAAARTMARPDYSAMAGAITSLDDLGHTGTGGNSDLKPVRSNNFDVAAEWYFAPRSLLSFGLFYMNMTSYVSFGTAPQVAKNQTTKQFETYQITSPVNIGAKNKGYELNYQQPIAGNFGVLANYTYANGEADDGTELVGSSKNTYNLTGYYEDDRLNARLAYTYRSAFLVGLDRSFAQHEDATGNLAASLDYKLTDNFTLSFEALNLNNPTLKYYGNNKDQPRALYSSGRQFYFGIRAKM